MLQKKLNFIFGLLVLAGMAFAVTGVLVDKLGKQIPRVKVELLLDGSVVSTGSDGGFQIQSTTATRPGKSTSIACRLENGILHFILPTGMRGSLLTSDIHGKQIHFMSEQMFSAGEHLFSPFGSVTATPGVYVVQYQMGSQKGTFKLAVTSTSNLAGNGFPFLSGILARTTEGVLDSIRFSKQGYVVKTLPINDYSVDLGNVNLDVASSSSAVASSSSIIASSSVAVLSSSEVASSSSAATSSKAQSSSSPVSSSSAVASSSSARSSSSVVPASSQAQSSSSPVSSSSAVASSSSVRSSSSVAVSSSSALNTEARLQSLLLQPDFGSLNSSFNANTFNYVRTVAFTDSQVSFKASAYDSYASRCRVNGVEIGSTNVMSAPFPLTILGDTNVFNVVSYAQDTTVTKTYRIAIFRPKPDSNALLTNLSSSLGAFAPTFAQNTFLYLDTVNWADSVLTITPTSTYPLKGITVNGNVTASGQASAQVKLTKTGDTTQIPIVVTAQDTSRKNTYVLSVLRKAASSDARLSTLTSVNGNLSPQFQESISEYDLYVAYTVASVAFVASTWDSYATVKLNGGATTAALNLGVAGTSIDATFHVTAQDLSTKDYVVHVHRQKAPTILWGTITADSTLTKANSPYLVSSMNFAVDNGATLTVEPGVRIEVDGSKSRSITIRKATLKAVGTEADPIVFSRNGTSNWQYLLFTDTATDAVLDNNLNYKSGSILRNVVIEYGGAGTYDNNQGALYMKRCKPYLERLTVRNSTLHAVVGTNLSGTMRIRKTAVYDNGGLGMYLGGSNFTVRMDSSRLERNHGEFYQSDSVTALTAAPYSYTSTLVNDTIRNSLTSGGSDWWRGNGIMLVGADWNAAHVNSISVDSCLIDGNGANGLYGYSDAGMKRYSIKNSTVSNNGGHGFWELGTCGYYDWGFDALIDNVKFIGNQDAVGGLVHDFFKMTNSVVQGQRSTGANNSGLDIARNNWDTGKAVATITGSRIEQNSNAGDCGAIQIGTLSSISSWCSGTGIKSVTLDSNVIIGNSAHNGAGGCIVGNDTVVMRKNYIADNQNKSTDTTTTGSWLLSGPMFQINQNVLLDTGDGQKKFPFINNNANTVAAIDLTNNWWGTTDLWTITQRNLDNNLENQRGYNNVTPVLPATVADVPSP